MFVDDKGQSISTVLSAYSSEMPFSSKTMNKTTQNKRKYDLDSIK